MMNRFRRDFFCQFRSALMIPAFFLWAAEVPAEPEYADLNSLAHAYWTRPLRDPFSRIRGDLESGRLPLDYSSDRAVLSSLLGHLGVPPSSTKGS